MGIWSTLFNSSDTVSKVTDAVINTGDALFYTDEEKATDRKAQREHFPILLAAYAPFKIAQRILAIWFSALFGSAFIIGLIGTIFNAISAYKQTLANIDREVPLAIVQIPMKPLLDLVIAFNMGTIIAIIIAWYFSGGVIDSFKRKQ